MTRPTYPLKRVCYADIYITVWSSGVNIPDLELSLNSYIEEITLLTLDTLQFRTHPRILIEESHLPLVQCPKILGVYLNPSLSFNKHSHYAAESVSNIYNILKSLVGTSWGQQKKTLRSEDRSSITLHLFGVQPYTTPTTEKSNIHRTRLCGLPLAVARRPVSITYTQKLKC